MAASAQNYPVVVGVGQLTNHPASVDDAIEPMELMVRAAGAAEADAGVKDLLASADSIQVAGILGWPHTDTPGTLAERVGARPAHTLYSSIGGDTPQRLINAAAQAIADGRLRVVLIAGAEALDSQRMARRTGQRLPWSPRGQPQHIEGDTRPGFNEVEAKHGLTLPTRMYPLFESAIRAHLGLSIDDHKRRLGQLCAEFSAVAALNPYAWFREVLTPEEVTTVGAKNRMVCFPYPKLMNAMIEVDQAAAVILTGSRTARELGIPEEQWVYLHGCGDANDKWFVSERVNYHSSPAIRAATRRALGMAGVSVADISLFDLYSCFPSAVQLALDALGVPIDDPRPFTVTGGLPRAGGPGNNYVTHAVATMVQRLRERRDQYGLVTGLGWFATKHSAAVYSALPPSGPWRRTDPAVDQAAVDAMDSPPFAEWPDGPATVETYTVAFDNEGEPQTGIVIGRLADGDGPRFIANTEPDPDLLRSMCGEEFVGRRGHVCQDAASGKNVFRP